MKRRYLWGILAAVMALGTIGCGKKADVQTASVTEGKEAQKVPGADSQSETSGAQEQPEGTAGMRRNPKIKTQTSQRERMPWKNQQPGTMERHTQSG